MHIFHLLRLVMGFLVIDNLTNTNTDFITDKMSEAVDSTQKLCSNFPKILMNGE
jgi:hypothetical protein